jgi:HTH-type transcriptional regulator/antitoxin HigA
MAWKARICFIAKCNVLGQGVSVMSATLADPVRMIQMGAPRLIESDQELEVHTRALFELTAKTDPSADEIDAINLLSTLVQHYEAERFPVPDVPAADMLRYLMELKGLTQADLVPVLGSQPLVSLLLSGARNLTVQHIAALSDLFQVSPSVFFPAQKTT